MIVDKVGRGVPAGLGIEVLANGETKSLVARLRGGAFVTGPTEVVHCRREGIGNPVNLLPAIPPDVADPEFIGAGSDRKPKGIAESVAHDAPGIGVGTGGEGIVGEGGARERINPYDSAV
jgi:hypothetical protein